MKGVPCRLVGRASSVTNLSEWVRNIVGWSCFVAQPESSGLVVITSSIASLCSQCYFSKSLSLSYFLSPVLLRNLVSRMSGNSYSFISCLWSSRREACNRNSWGSDDYSCGTLRTISSLLKLGGQCTMEGPPFRSVLLQTPLLIITK